MKIGYARVSTRDQNADLQLDALKKAGCERIYQDVASGAKSARPELDKLLANVRAGDTLVFWKLDRLGRSLKHLVNLVGELSERGVYLQSLNDPIDTTNAQGRLVFNLFASLAEFERELISERTHAGLSAARARGRVGGRPKGLSTQAESTAMVAETLYREKRLSVNAIAKQLHISKSTLYRYLQHRNIDISSYKNNQQENKIKPVYTELLKNNDQKKRVGKKGIVEEQKTKILPVLKTTKIILWLEVENNSKFVRGKSKSRQRIEEDHLSHFHAKKLEKNGWEYELRFQYENDEDLERQIDNLSSDMDNEADLRDGFIECTFSEVGTDRYW